MLIGPVVPPLLGSVLLAVPTPGWFLRILKLNSELDVLLKSASHITILSGEKVNVIYCSASSSVSPTSTNCPFITLIL